MFEKQKFFITVIFQTKSHKNYNHIYQFIQSNVINSFFFFFFGFLKPHCRHMEVPRLGAESQLQLMAYTLATATHLSHII